MKGEASSHDAEGLESARAKLAESVRGIKDHRSSTADRRLGTNLLATAFKGRLISSLEMHNAKATVIQKHVRMRHKRLWFLGLRRGSTLIQRSWRRSAFWTQFKESDPRQRKIEADWMARTIDVGTLPPTTAELVRAKVKGKAAAVGKVAAAMRVQVAYRGHTVRRRLRADSFIPGIQKSEDMALQPNRSPGKMVSIVEEPEVQEEAGAEYRQWQELVRSKEQLRAVLGRFGGVMHIVLYESGERVSERGLPKRSTEAHALVSFAEETSCEMALSRKEWAASLGLELAPVSSQSLGRPPSFILAHRTSRERVKASLVRAQGKRERRSLLKLKRAETKRDSMMRLGLNGDGASPRDSGGLGSARSALISPSGSARSSLLSREGSVSPVAGTPGGYSLASPTAESGGAVAAEEEEEAGRQAMAEWWTAVVGAHGGALPRQGAELRHPPRSPYEAMQREMAAATVRLRRVREGKRAQSARLRKAEAKRQALLWGRDTALEVQPAGATPHGAGTPVRRPAAVAGRRPATAPGSARRRLRAGKPSTERSQSLGAWLAALGAGPSVESLWRAAGIGSVGEAVGARLTEPQLLHLGLGQMRLRKDCLHALRVLEEEAAAAAVSQQSGGADSGSGQPSGRKGRGAKGKGRARGKGRGRGRGRGRGGRGGQALEFFASGLSPRRGGKGRKALEVDIEAARRPQRSPSPSDNPWWTPGAASSPGGGGGGTQRPGWTSRARSARLVQLDESSGSPLWVKPTPPKSKQRSPRGGGAAGGMKPTPPRQGGSGRRK